MFRAAAAAAEKVTFLLTLELYADIINRQLCADSQNVIFDVKRL